jgi:hypothetical protein
LSHSPRRLALLIWPYPLWALHLFFCYHSILQPHIFPVLSLELATSSRSSGSIYWRAFRNQDLDAECAQPQGPLIIRSRKYMYIC